VYHIQHGLNVQANGAFHVREFFTNTKCVYLCVCFPSIWPSRVDEWVVNSIQDLQYYWIPKENFQTNWRSSRLRPDNSRSERLEVASSFPAPWPYNSHAI